MMIRDRKQQWKTGRRRDIFRAQGQKAQGAGVQGSGFKVQKAQGSERSGSE